MRRWWQRRSLHFRLALWYALGGTLLLAAFSMAIYVFVAMTMARPLDHQLRQDMALVSQRLKVLPGRKIIWDGTTLAPDVASKWSDPWFELWDEEGHLVCRFWPFNEKELDQLPYAPVRNRETISVFSVAPDLRLRVLSMPYPVAGQEPAWMIRVLRVHEPAAEALSALLLIITIALPAVVALLVYGGYVVTKHWLKPLDEMVMEADRITADDLGRRLSVKNSGDELSRLASVFNVTLDRLEGSFRALDRFVADASHEIRTPLTTLRSVGEVALRRGRTPDEYREIIGSMLEEAARLQFLTERLLELARAEGGVKTAPRQMVRLEECIAECLNELGVLAENKRQRIVFDARECSVETDPVIFRQALQNLIDNAVKYSPADTVITVSLAETGRFVAVTVTDQGPGIAPEQRSQITDRFFRADAARARDQGGFGLGLALTNAYMRMLGGRLEYEPAQPLGSRFGLMLPKD
jgi:heavy metal sensor kinase